ncbi:ABC transporter permease [Neoaquamicrobium sediminum]|uniref:ABC transporter permease n=1 Tax=Neoaquamicrobium sediminum TaxID=1849104 RepID=UPI0015639F36|nr:ABC transporter permease [Mesorhizobium sediminum]MBX9453638.1 ABC transporter permease subunit [Mesorhizobium sp.]NRC56923.1 ABC transporter permease [Mesorhizobium sediminum]
MLKYMTRAGLKIAITFLAIVTLAFAATRLSGDPINYIAGQGLTQADRDLLVTYYGLDRSILEQYLAFMGSFFDGEFGLSFVERRPVSVVIAERIWPSLQLLLASTALTLALAIPLGIVAAVWRKSWVGSAVMTLAFLFYAVPNFVLAVFMILVFSYWLNWLPVVGNGTWAHFLMPTIAMSGLLIAGLTRFTRNAMLDVLGQDFIRTARAKGLAETEVILRHGLRNASITILSVIGLQVASLAAAGSVVVESIFAWPGIGELLVRSAIQRDYPVLQFGVIAVSIAVLIINAVVDLAYTWADPRIRLGEA